VVHGEDHQIVLVDTPGLHRPRTELGSRLNGLVYGTLADSDALVFMIDATMPIGPGDRRIADRLIDSGADVVVAVNKVDAASRDETLTQLVRAAEWPFEEYFPISAQSGDGVPELVSGIVSRLPEGPQFYPVDMITDQPEAMVIGEIVREKFLDRLRDELPHALVVRVEDIETREDGVLDIAADVIVERNSQKGIVIGKGGRLLKTAGTEAREELESLLATPVNLMLHVVVEKDWQQTPKLLDHLGFEER
ncbi:MAG TPA: GTPase Era, partial [Acidimicrobiia bacterium]|nr:GTPase Era [Acidimicrobiia bacterium]